MRRNGEFLGTIRNRLTTFLAVGSLALSSFVGSCSAKSQSPEPAPETSMSASATPGGLTYEELASEIGNGKPVWIAPVAYIQSTDGENSGKIVVRPAAEVNGDPTCQQPGESRQVGDEQVRYYAVEDGKLVEVDPPSSKAARRSDSVDENTVICVKFDGAVDGFQPGAELPTTMVIDGEPYRVVYVESSTKNSSTPRQALDPTDE
ncbi:hypothetical protein HG438_002595 [Candidatus Saccharibacteria bacterium]|nr:hypothetical protein [Candidatus Saccharibacteria bacterium]